MNELSQTLQDLPALSLIPVGLLVLVGLLLWGAGRRVLRTGFAAVGLLVGGGIGWLLGDSFNLGVPAWIVAVAVALVLAAVAALLYRFAVAGALACVLAVAAPLAVVVITELNPRVELRAPQADDADVDDASPPATPSERKPDEFDKWLDPERWIKDQIKDRLPGQLGENGELGQPLTPREIGERFGMSDEMGEQIDRLESYARRLIDAIGSVWSQTAPAIRPYLVASAIGGALLGLMLGAMAPGFSAAIVTAFGGSLLWLGGGRLIAEHMGYADASWMPAAGTSWLTIWVVTAMVGFAIQWTFHRRKADKSG
ncbi:MAG TPA: hypothetical protein PK098_02625 [Phycisphaerales bacterium]|nr:hypothetical protein [Phycisphaerales bacterium]